MSINVYFSFWFCRSASKAAEERFTRRSVTLNYDFISANCSIKLKHGGDWMHLAMLRSIEVGLFESFALCGRYIRANVLYIEVVVIWRIKQNLIFDYQVSLTFNRLEWTGWRLGRYARVTVLYIEVAEIWRIHIWIWFPAIRCNLLADSRLILKPWSLYRGVCPSYRGGCIKEDFRPTGSIDKLGLWAEVYVRYVEVCIRYTEVCIRYIEVCIRYIEVCIRYIEVVVIWKIFACLIQSINFFSNEPSIMVFEGLCPLYEGRVLYTKVVEIWNFFAHQVKSTNWLSHEPSIMVFEQMFMSAMSSVCPLYGGCWNMRDFSRQVKSINLFSN